MDKPKDELTLLRTAATLHTAVKMLPIDHQLSPKQLSALESFTSDLAEYYDQKAEKKASYNPASATIMGILKDMYDTFSMNLEKATEVEAVAQKNYESLIGVKENEMATLMEARKKKEGEKADAEKDLADNSQELDDTTKQMKADTIFFDETKAACQAKADEWAERVRARTEEMAGINKALELLTSDDAKALFNKSIKPGKETGFLQIASESQPQANAYRALKEHATKAKSLRLAAIAATLRTGGHFDAVIAEIDKMTATLKEEEKGDIEQRDWRKEETFKNEQEASRYEYTIERTDAKIMKLTSKREELESTLAATVQSILNTKDDIKAMEDARKEQHAAFESAKSDDEGAVKLLAAAIEAMSAFYKNNKIDQGEIQGAAQALVQEPVFEVSADQAPDATFTSAGKSGGESKGIVSIMTMIKEDLEDEISNGVKDEGETQAKFEEQLGEANTLLEELKAKKTNLEQAISDTNTEIDENEVKKEDLEGLLKDEKDYLASIKPDCDWILNSFTERRTKRAAEMEGLLQAKGMLAGASPAMMQNSVEFDDNDFAKMHFSGTSFLQKQQ